MGRCWRPMAQRHTTSGGILETSSTMRSAESMCTMFKPLSWTCRFSTRPGRRSHKRGDRGGVVILPGSGTRPYTRPCRDGTPECACREVQMGLGCFDCRFGDPINAAPFVGGDGNRAWSWCACPMGMASARRICASPLFSFGRSREMAVSIRLGRVRKGSRQGGLVRL